MVVVVVVVGAVVIPPSEFVVSTLWLLLLVSAEENWDALEDSALKVRFNSWMRILASRMDWAVRSTLLLRAWMLVILLSRLSDTADESESATTTVFEVGAKAPLALVVRSISEMAWL